MPIPLQAWCSARRRGSGTSSWREDPSFMIVGLLLPMRKPSPSRGIEWPGAYLLGKWYPALGDPLHVGRGPGRIVCSTPAEEISSTQSSLNDAASPLAFWHEEGRIVLRPCESHEHAHLGHGH